MPQGFLALFWCSFSWKLSFSANKKGHRIGVLFCCQRGHSPSPRTLFRVREHFQFSPPGEDEENWKCGQASKNTSKIPFAKCDWLKPTVRPRGSSKMLAFLGVRVTVARISHFFFCRIRRRFSLSFVALPQIECASKARAVVCLQA